MGNIGLQSEDYKVISSNSSYIEIEFQPQYNKPEALSYGGESFKILTFEDACSFGFEKPGEPDLRFRIFPVILPSELNNSLVITDYEVNEVKNVNLAPVPAYDGVTYLKNAVYSKNEFMPKHIVTLENIGMVREQTFGNIIIHPYQYNPVTRELRQLTRIRFKLTFGTAPVILNRQRSYPEIELLRDIAINSRTALNWMSPSQVNGRDNSPFIDSKLRVGDWYRIEIRDNGFGNSEGMYKLSKSYLENAGINLNNIDPHTIKMFGNGAGMLPENIEEPRPEDLIEIAVYIEGEQDGHFDPQDFIVFYGRSVHNWKYDSSSHRFKHSLHIYSNSNYYWINFNTPGQGRRMQNIPSENIQNPFVVSSTLQRLFYEPEVNNLISGGNIWLSERIPNGQSFMWNNTLTGLEANSDISYKIKLASHVFAPNENHFLLKEDRSVMSEIYLPMGNVYPGYGDWIFTRDTSFTLNASQKSPPNSEESNFRASFYSASPEGEGYLDWMEIQYKRRLNSVTTDFLQFISPDTDAVAEYNLSLFSNNSVKVFNITAHDSVKIIQPLNVSSGNVRFQKTETRGYLNYYAATGQNGYKTPTAISGRIPNQNLHGYTEGADFVIITHKDFLPAANRLKAMREALGPQNLDYLKTYIVETEKIYNEFSGGLLDAVAIRDYLKYIYDNWKIKPVYVLFLGDGDFDYKNVLVNDENWVPPFEFSDPNLNLVNNYVSDDFYVQIIGNDTRPDLAHGRLTCRSLAEANTYLDKLENYGRTSCDNKSNCPVGTIPGSVNWRNRIVFLADDGRTSGGNSGPIFTDMSEWLSEQVLPPSFEKNKVYLVEYPAINTPEGRRKPDVNKELARQWNRGCAAISVIGYGGCDHWTHEYIEPDINLLHNKCYYPFVAVSGSSFESTRFDNPLTRCITESFALVQNKGAIGILGGTRPLYVGQSALFMNKCWYELFTQRDTLRLPRRTADAVFRTKQVYYTANDLKFELICDPTVRLQIPRYITSIDSIGGLNNDTMNALSKVKIYGSVLKPDSVLWQDYNGDVIVKAYEAIIVKTIIDEDNFVYRFKVPGKTIFNGNQKVVNGKWTAEFIVPKDISYLNQKGKVIGSFWNENASGHGFDTSFYVGGLNLKAMADSTGPELKLYINNRNFRSRDVVNENVTFIADLFDESGINITGTLGHRIEAVLDNNNNSIYDLTEYYVSDSTYRSGTLSYDLASLSDGVHTLKIKAWDTYNNSSESQTEFTVMNSAAFNVINVYNYPNPFKDRTTFTFQHNYSCALNVRIKIYTVAGRLIKEIKKNNIFDKFAAIDWEGTDEDGEHIANGVYIYRMTVTSEDGKSETSTGKLAVLR